MIEGMEGVSSFAPQIDYAFWIVNLICLFLFVVTIGAMFIFIYKYSEKRSKPEDTENIKHNTPLEIAWTIIPTILMMVIFYIGLDALKIQRTMPKDADAIVVQVIGKKWSWSFEYENGKKSSKLIVPINKDVKLYMTAPIGDVLHAFFVAAFRIKEDIVPGQVTRLWFNATKIGEYDIQCAEYCGTRHAYMRSSVVVVSQEDFDEFLNPKVEVIKTADQIFADNGCVGCHSSDGTAGVGPTFKDMYGKEVKVLVDGKSKLIVRDEDYLIQAIENPNLHIVEGYYPDMMPSFKGALSKEEMGTVINYFKGVKVDTKPMKKKINAKELIDVNGCVGCHTFDGTPSAGPTFKNIFNRETSVLINGEKSTIKADEDYLKESITHPGAKVVEGFTNFMPPFKDVLTQEEVDAIVKYLKK